MRQRGTITIFLCLVLVSISAVICGLVESARMAGVRFYLQLAADSAIDSLFSEYDNKLWEEYRLISGVFSDEEEIQSDLHGYVKPYVEESGIYQIKEAEFEILDKQMMTDEGGAWLEEEAYEYMKYKVASDLILHHDPSEVWRQIKEAQSMNTIVSNYGFQSKTAVRLEKSLMRIGEYIEDQKQIYQRATEALNGYDLNDFISHANALKRKCKEADALVNTYSRLADQLEEELRKTERENEDKWKDLSEENQRVLKEQVEQFRPYVERNGERRAAVEALLQNAEQIIQISEEAIQLAEDIRVRKEEEENSARDTDDDGIIDEYDEYVEYEEDMGRLRTAFGTVRIADIGFQYGMEDEETADILSSLQEALQSGVLELVIPSDRDVQHGSIHTSNLPSHTDKTNRTVEQADLIKTLLVNEYAIEHFPCFTDNADREFAYELEYIIEGSEKGGANLSAVVMKLVAVRSGLNYLHILSDSEKMNQVNVLANSIAVAGGIPFLNALVKLLIISVWALAEAVLDVKDLLAGKEVHLLKSPKDWHLSIDKIADVGRNRELIKSGDFSTGESKKDSTSEGEKFLKMDYKLYLRLLLFIQKPEDRNYRIMDLIQNNLRKTSPEFQMRNCMYSMRVKVDAKFAMVFSDLGLVKGELTGIGKHYKITTETAKAY